MLHCSTSVSGNDEFFDALDGDADTAMEIPTDLDPDQNITLSEMLDLSESPSLQNSSSILSPDDFQDAVDVSDAADGITEGLEGLDGAAELAAEAGGEDGVLATAGRSIRRIFEDTNDDDTGMNYLDQLVQQDGSQLSQMNPSMATGQESSLMAAQESSRNLTTAAA